MYIFKILLFYWNYILLVFIVFFIFNFKGVPGRPKGPLDVIKVSYDFVDIEWKAPDVDGGTPITKYIIEYKSASRLAWFKSEEVEAHVFVSRIKGLVEGTEYYFRVIAVNEEGAGPPLETTDTTKPTREIRKFFTY